MKIVALADTHLRSHRAHQLPPALFAAVERADAVLHGGDVVSAEVLEVLGALAPTHAVLGNNDHDLVGLLPDRLVLDLDGVMVGMVHDSGSRRGRERRLRLAFPEADLVVFGHSHIPWNAAGLDGQWLVNPGSPTQRRSQPQPTFATIEVAAGQVMACEIVTV